MAALELAIVLLVIAALLLDDIPADDIPADDITVDDILADEMLMDDIVLLVASWLLIAIELDENVLFGFVSPPPHALRAHAMQNKPDS